MRPSAPRILEIGAWTYCKDEYPDSTVLLWTGERPLPPQRGHIDSTPRALFNALREARASRFDVIVVYMQLRSPWHPRYWLRSLLREPLRPFAALTRVFGVALLRFLPTRTPIVALDMNDSFNIGRHNFFLLDRADVVFKRELPSDRWHVLVPSVHSAIPTRRIRKNPKWIARLSRLRPIALPAARINAPLSDRDAFPEKTADVFFSGDVSDNSWVRCAGIAELDALRAKGFVIDIPEHRLPHDEFLRRMSSAWLAWSPAGFSWECYRTAEAAQCLTVPVINYPTVERHAPLRQNEHVLFYDPAPGGLAAEVEGALQDKAKLQRMAFAAREHVLTHHVQRALIDQIVAAGLERATHHASEANSLTTRS